MKRTIYGTSLVEFIVDENKNLLVISADRQSENERYVLNTIPEEEVKGLVDYLMKEYK